MSEETTPYARARALQAQGVSPEQIRAALAEGGLDADSVNVVLACLGPLPERVEHLVLEPTSDEPSGQHHLYVGAVMLVFGAAIALVTHEAAEARGGGTRLLAWGALVFCALRFLRGLLASGG